MHRKIIVIMLCSLIACSADDYQVDSEVANEWVENDLASIAQEIVDDNLTEEEFNSLGLTDDEVVDLIFEVGYIRGHTFEELEREFFGDAPILQVRDACTQTIEKANLSGDTYSYTHYQDTWCDGDGGDTDWIYNFAPAWADNADDLRWWADDWWVRTTFSGAYSGELIGYSMCSTPVQLCVGTTGVSVAGGHNAVANNLFISH